MFGFTTVRQGKRVALWNRNGSVQIVDGPAMVNRLLKTLEYLEQYAAGNDEYLDVTYRDGHHEHLRGPVSVWWDPVEHTDIKIGKALAVDANEAIVVYRQEESTVSRRIVRGPDMFVPGANEWLHEFKWHGADPKNPTKKIYGALQFNKLRVIPDQMYHDIYGVRTGNDALLTVKLMIFFELVDIEKMLDKTHDPVADFINAVTADVIDFAARQTFEQFKENTDRLNELETYPQLIQRSETIGYKIAKVVYRGYTANEALQLMHDQAIEARTRLKLEAETQEQAQDLEDLRLQREGEREIQRREMAEAAKKHEVYLDTLVNEAQLKNDEDMRRQEIQLDAFARESALDAQNKEDKAKAAFLKDLREMGVDVTRYLVAQNDKADKVIRIEEGLAKVHLHEGAF